MSPIRLFEKGPELPACFVKGVPRSSVQTSASGTAAMPWPWPPRAADRVGPKGGAGLPICDISRNARHHNAGDGSRAVSRQCRCIVAWATGECSSRGRLCWTRDVGQMPAPVGAPRAVLGTVAASAGLAPCCRPAPLYPLLPEAGALWLLAPLPPSPTEPLSPMSCRSWLWRFFSPCWR